MFPESTTDKIILIPYKYEDARILLAPTFLYCPSVPVFYIIRTHPRNQRWRNVVRSTWAGPLKNSLVSSIRRFLVFLFRKMFIYKVIDLKA